MVYFARVMALQFAALLLLCLVAFLLHHGGGWWRRRCTCVHVETASIQQIVQIVCNAIQSCIPHRAFATVNTRRLRRRRHRDGCSGRACGGDDSSYHSGQQRVECGAWCGLQYGNTLLRLGSGQCGTGNDTTSTRRSRTQNTQIATYGGRRRQRRCRRYTEYKIYIRIMLQRHVVRRVARMMYANDAVCK